ncbi:MAG: pyridoxal phosphate-dependent aminotransferase [Deltaproteobacteria bacterium]|nr:pyridoxal phosphate-dependent aminotransferase [Deltaproteobacteria bacterium]
MALADFKLSPYGAASSRPSPVSRMMADIAADFRVGIDINLGVGYVNENTIPRDLIREALDAVLADRKKYKLALNYGGPHGSPNLISSLENYIINHKAGGLTREALAQNEIIIGANGATSLLEGIAHVLKPGIVITSDPMYYIYCDFLERSGFKVVTVPEDKSGIRTDLLREKIERLAERKKEISFLYMVTVNNPTGSILINSRRAELVQITTKLSRELGRKVPLIFDKAYEDLVHSDSENSLDSGLLNDEHGLVYEIGTVSKILSPSLRIGYMIGRAGPFMHALVQKTSDVGFSAPLITQEITSYLLDHHIETQIARVNSGYRRKAAQVKTWIGENLGSLLESISGGQAGFYYYLTFKNIRTSEEAPFFKYLSRNTSTVAIDGPPDNRHPRVTYLPGQFCVHPQGDMVAAGSRQLRLSYGFEELDAIEKALNYMREAAAFALAQNSGS